LAFDADDIDPANVARISFDKLDSGRTRADDLKLYEYLIKNSHTTPIETIEIWLEMKLPIFLARQFIRHRTMSFNEMSGRYATLPQEWYLPEIVGGKSKDKKQGQEDNLPKEIQDWFISTLDSLCYDSYGRYLQSLRSGVAAEHARLFLHLNHYTHWTMKVDLHNMMHFLSLRLHEHAQVEAIAYAEAIYSLLKIHLPKSMEYFDIFKRKLSKEEKELNLNLLQAGASARAMTEEEKEVYRKLCKRSS
jgi:thymidylate synthase (FAD)